MKQDRITHNKNGN